MRLKLSILMVFSAIVNIIHAQKKISLFGNLKFGPYEIGVTQLSLVDTLRKEPGEIRINIWYPAKRNSEKITLADYLNYKNGLNKSEVLEDISVGIGGKRICLLVIV